MHSTRLAGLTTIGLALAACGGPAAAPRPAPRATSCPELPVLESGTQVEGELARRGEYATPCGREGEEPTTGEALFILPVEVPSRVMVHLDARFRPVLFVRNDCVDTYETVLACRSGSQMTTPRQRRRARTTLWTFDFVLDAGRHVLLVDGYDRGGPFTITADVLAGIGEDESVTGLAELTEACEAAPVLESGVEVMAPMGTRSRFDSVCGGYGFGPEAVFTFDAPRRAEVEIEVTSRFEPVMYVRSQCEDPGTTAWCESSAHEAEEFDDEPLKRAAQADPEAAPRPPPESRLYTLSLSDAGRYWLFVDTADPDAVGPRERLTVRAEIGSSQRSRGR